MRLYPILLVALGAATPVMAQVGVDGYIRRDGTYVAPYQRTRPDGTVTNNYSYQPPAPPPQARTRNLGDVYGTPATPRNLGDVYGQKPPRR